MKQNGKHESKKPINKVIKNMMLIVNKGIKLAVEA